MRSATENQRDISMGLKNGFMHLESSLDIIYLMRNLWRVSLDRIRETEAKATQVPSSSMGSATTALGTTWKRQATSPPMEERIDKHPKECYLISGCVNWEATARLSPWRRFSPSPSQTA